MAGAPQRSRPPLLLLAKRASDNHARQPVDTHEARPLREPAKAPEAGLCRRRWTLTSGGGRLRSAQATWRPQTYRRTGSRGGCDSSVKSLWSCGLLCRGIGSRRVGRRLVPVAFSVVALGGACCGAGDDALRPCRLHSRRGGQRRCGSAWLRAIGGLEWGAAGRDRDPVSRWADDRASGGSGGRRSAGGAARERSHASRECHQGV